VTRCNTSIKQAAELKPDHRTKQD